MLSELPANSFVYCVSSRITPKVFQVSSQLISNSVFRILWVTLNFYRVASPVFWILWITLDVIGVASQLISNSVFRILWVTLNFYRVASPVFWILWITLDVIGVASQLNSLCVLDFANYIGRVSSCQSTQLILCFGFL